MPVIARVQVAGLSGRSDKSLERLCVSPDGQLTAFTLKGGAVAVVDNRTNRSCVEVKMNGTARSIAFAPSPSSSSSSSPYLTTSGGDGDVYVWDIRYAARQALGGGGHRCVAKWANEGGMPTCGLAVSPAAAMFPSAAASGGSSSSGGGGSGGGSSSGGGMPWPLAVASESGVVNLYRGLTGGSAGGGGRGGGGGGGVAPAAPLKSLMNLTTPVETLRFNHDGQLLAMASRWAKNALRVVHLPSATVFANWPTSKSPLNYVFSLDFSPSSGFLAVGNDKGRVLLYRLRHYSEI